MDVNILGAILIISYVLVMLITAELLTHKGIMTKGNARKLVHISVGNIVIFIPIFTNQWIATAVPALFIGGNFLMSPLSPIKKMRLKSLDAASGHSLGTVYYAVSLTIVTYFGFKDPWIIAAAFLPLVYGDGFAAVAGSYAKTGHFKVIGGNKTFLGTSSMAIASWLSVMVFIFAMGYDIRFAILVSLIAALLGVIIELLSPKGLDNILIPIILLIIFLFLGETLETAMLNVDPVIFFIGLALGLIIAVLGYKAKSLTLDGAFTGFFIGLFIFGLGSWVFGMQLFLFFFLGSVATKVISKKQKDIQDEFEKGGSRRDMLQAGAKSGLGAILTLLYVINPDPIYIYFFSGILTAALVDTMSTEIGIAMKGKPVIAHKPWKKAEKGEPGAISLYGTLGGLLFGLIFTSIIYLFSLFDNYLLNSEITPIFILIIPVAGLLGMLADSIIGGTLQRMNQCVECGKIVESNWHCEKATTHHKGIKWINNDMNNLLGTTIGGLFGLIFYILLV
jgi:uncharacterized protein (TIGR00297 family)